MRVGFATGYDAGATVPVMASWVKRAEDRGFEIGFFSETANLMRDAVSTIAACGLSTKNIRLGFTQIVRLRSPVVMAQTLATLDELTGGRIVLCPGACTQDHMRIHSLVDFSPAKALTEWVESMRLLLTGERMTYQGDIVRLAGVGIGWRPLRAHVPFWIAATSQTGLRLAAKLGDGVILNAVSSPEYSANAVAFLKKAVTDAGKDWDRFEVAQIINCSIEENHSAAIDAVRWEVASKFNPVKAFAQIGPRKRVGEPFIFEKDLAFLEDTYARDGMAGLIRAFPTSWIEGLTASGTPEEVVRRVHRYMAAGVTLPILRPAASHQVERLIDLFSPRPDPHRGEPAGWGG